MIAQALGTRFDIFFIIFFICPNESKNQLGHYPLLKTGGLGVAHNVLRDIRRPQFVPLRSHGSERPSSGFNLTDEEIKKFNIWEKGMVPFYIDVLSFSDKVLRGRIRWFLNEVNSLGPLNFMELPSPPKDSETRWVFFVNRRGQLDCADHPIKNFTNKGVQRVVLGYDCINSGAGLAEIVLAIAGIPPQHNAPDRDEYITIEEENIIPEKRYLFEKLDDNEWLFHDLKYDFNSAGHYHHHKHSANGRATIKAKKVGGAVTMGDKRGFSPSDIVKMLLVYNYIVKKNINGFPACNKLFSRGKSVKMTLESVEDIIPIPKPRKYTGEKELPNGNNSQETYYDSNYARSSETTANDESSSSGFENSVDNKKIFSPTRNNVPEKSEKLTIKMTYEDPLSYLSDYQTGDENMQRSVWRKNRDYYNFGKVGAYFKSV